MVCAYQGVIAINCKFSVKNDLIRSYGVALRSAALIRRAAVAREGAIPCDHLEVEEGGGGGGLVSRSGLKKAAGN